MTIADIMMDAQAAARVATEKVLANGGDRDLCGFAWVTVLGIKGNSKIGRELIANGFKKPIVGKGLMWWNPSGSMTQAIGAKEAGAEAAAEVLKARLGPGVTVFYDTRLD